MKEPRNVLASQSGGLVEVQYNERHSLKNEGV